MRKKIVVDLSEISTSFIIKGYSILDWTLVFIDMNQEMPKIVIRLFKQDRRLCCC